MQVCLHQIKGMEASTDYINRFSLETYGEKRDDFRIMIFWDLIL